MSSTDDPRDFPIPQDDQPPLGVLLGCPASEPASEPSTNRGNSSDVATTNISVSTFTSEPSEPQRTTGFAASEPTSEPSSVHSVHSVHSPSDSMPFTPPITQDNYMERVYGRKKGGKVAKDKNWKAVADMEATVEENERYLEDIPWITNYATTTLSAQPGDGKTTLIYPILHKFLQASDGHYVGFLSEQFRFALRDIKASYAEDTLDRIWLQSTAIATEEWLAERLNHWRKELTKQPSTHRLLVVVDTLIPMMTTWGLEVLSNSDATKFFSFFKQQMDLWDQSKRPISFLFLHHAKRPQNNDKAKPADAMGAQSIISQCNTRVNMMSDKLAQMTSVEWTSQVIDVGSMAFKMTAPLQVGDRRVFSDYEIVEADMNMLARQETQAELERLADAAAFYILAAAGEISSRGTQVGLRSAISCGSKVAADLERQLIQEQIIERRNNRNAEAIVHDNLAAERATSEGRIAYVRQMLHLPVATYSFANNILSKEFTADE